MIQESFLKLFLLISLNFVECVRRAILRNKTTCYVDGHDAPSLQ